MDASPVARAGGAASLLGAKRVLAVNGAPAFLAEMAPLVKSGAVKYREDIRQGLETVPACFAEMLRGDNFGKMLVQVGADPTLRG